MAGWFEFGILPIEKKELTSTINLGWRSHSHGIARTCKELILPAPKLLQMILCGESCNAGWKEVCCPTKNIRGSIHNNVHRTGDSHKPGR